MSDLSIAQHLINQLAPIVTSGAHAAWGMAVQVERINGIATEVSNGVGIIGGLIALVICFSLSRIVYAIGEKDDWDNPTWLVLLGFVGTGCLLGAVVAITNVVQMTNIWPWITISDPQLGLAHDLIQKALSPQ